MNIYKVKVTQELVRTLEVTVRAEDEDDAEIEADEAASEAGPEAWDETSIKHTEYAVEEAPDGDDEEED